jgi:uncharacterized protein involved in exopolysaccharide biosynthesis
MELTRTEEASLFGFGTLLLRKRWKIARLMILGGVIAAIAMIVKPASYTASASFLPQGNDNGRSALASLAGQIGVAFPSSNQSLSPEFYALLLTSRVLLISVVSDTLTVNEMGGKRVPLLTLFDVRGDSRTTREERGVALLRNLVKVSVGKTTGVVEFSLATHWPSVSTEIVGALVNGVNDFNLRTRQSQATAERKFVEARLAIAGADLRSSEDRLESFLGSNRAVGSAPELTFARDRLQRDVMLKQQVFTALTQSYEEVRLREVRDTPVITIVEAPSVETLQHSRGRVLGILSGIMLGAFLGVAMVFVSALNAYRPDGKESDEFALTLREVKSEIMGPVRWIKARIGR